MLQPRMFQQAAKRFAVVNPSKSLTSSTRFATPIYIGTGRYTQARSAATQPTSTSDAYTLLASQRRHRPVSPHLGIYKPQITWYVSGLNRITGSILSGGFYVFGAAYLVAPLFGWHLDSATMAAAFGGLPVVVQFLAKLVAAFPFTFHSFNGVRHLVWDMGMQMKNQQVIRSGWTVVGLSVASSLVLALV